MRRMGCMGVHGANLGKDVRSETKKKDVGDK